MLVQSDSFEICEDLIIHEADFFCIDMVDQFLDDMVAITAQNKGADTAFKLVG